MAINKDKDAPAEPDAQTTDAPAGGDVEVATDADVAVATDASATADLSTGKGVGDVAPEDIPDALEASNLPPEVRAELVRNHPVDPGAQQNTVTVREQPMPVVTGPGPDGAAANDRPIKRYRSDAHPELVVWHPNGERTIQFHNGEFATANEEWQAVLERTPEVDGPVGEIPQGKALLDEQGNVVSLAGADVQPIRVADTASA